MALRLIDDGAILVADDYCELTAEGQSVHSATPAQIAGKLEVRGYGIVTLPYQPHCTIRLVIDLAPQSEIPRMPDDDACDLLGVPLPRAWIDPATPSAAARVRVILRDLAARAGGEVRSA